MKWLRYLVAAIVCLNFTLTATAAAKLTLGVNRGTPRIISIAPGPTTEAAGERLLEAVEAIDDASATHPYLIMLDPGEYDLGDTTLEMKSYVSLRGSGREMTRISGEGEFTYLVRTANNTDIGSLTLEHRGGGTEVKTLSSNNVSSVGIYNLRVISSNATSTIVGISNYQSSPTIRNVTVYSNGTGATHVDGIVNENSSSPSIWHAQIIVIVSKNGMGSGIKSSTDCSPDIYDANVQLTVGDAGRGEGLYFIDNCSASINRVKTFVNGGKNIVGIFNSSNSYLTLQNIKILVDGNGEASEAYGIKCIADSTLDLERGIIDVREAVAMTGIEGASGWSPMTMTINRSTVRTTGTSIRTAVDLTVRVASSVIRGPIDNWLRGPFTCVNCVDTDYNPLDENCFPTP